MFTAKTFNNSHKTGESAASICGHNLQPASDEYKIIHEATKSAVSDRKIFLSFGSDEIESKYKIVQNAAS